MLSPETLEWLRQTARQGHSYSLAHLDHVERLDALSGSLETAMKRIAALESFFERAEAAVDPLLAGGPLPAGAAWVEREGREVFAARPVPCPAAEAGEPADGEPQTLHSVALKMLDTLAQSGVLPEILDTLRRAIREPMEPAAAAAAPVATDAELWMIWNRADIDIPRTLRALYNLGREHGGASQASCPHIRSSDEGTSYCALAQQVAAAPEPIEPEVPVVEVDVCLVDQIRRHAPMAIGTAEAILYVVSAWLDRRQLPLSAWQLRAQCAASQEERVNG